MPFRSLAPTAFGVLLLALVAGGCAGAMRELTTESRPDELDDLAVQSVTASQPFPIPLEALQIRAIIENRAAHPVAAVQVVLRDQGRQLDSRTVSVPAGAQIPVTFDWKPERSGLHTPEVAILTAPSLSERDRADNMQRLEIIVADPPAPGVDLEIAGVEMSPARRGPSALRIVVRNNGRDAASAPIRVQDEALRIVRLVGPIDAGGTQTIEIPWPAGQPVHRAKIELNPRHRLAEPNSENNLAPLTSLVALALRDLQIEGVSIHTERAEPGRNPRATFSFRVVNAGTLGVDPFRVRMTPSRFSDSGPLPLFHAVPGLAAGERMYFSHTVRNTPGTFELEIVVDVDGSVAEDDEANNLFTYRVEDGDAQPGRWVSIGPRRILGRDGVDATGRLSALAIHPVDPSLIYVGATPGHASLRGMGGDAGPGVWKTVDGGSSWEPIADALPSMSIEALAIDPSLHDRIYALAGGRMFRSEDGGASWMATPSGGFATNRGRPVLRIHPANPDVLYLAALNGLWRSRDAAGSWQRLDVTSSAGDSISAQDLVLNALDPDRLFVAIRKEGDPAVTGIYRTTDGGDNWAKLTGCPGGALPSLNANLRLAISGSTLYAAFKTCSKDTPECTGEDSWTIYRTTDIGCSIGGRLESQWESGWSFEGEAAKKMFSGIHAAPDNPRFVYATGVDFWMSSDFGETFQKSSGAHVDHHAFAVNPLSPEIVYTACDGGLYRSVDRGRTFQFAADGLLNAEFYDGADTRHDPQLTIGGTQDNGTMTGRAGVLEWTELRGGDGASVAIDPSTSDVLYAGGQNVAIYRSTDGGDFSAIRPNDEDVGCFNPHFQVHPTNHAVILESCESLWKGVRGSSGSYSWSAIFEPDSGVVTRSAIDAGRDIYYAGTSEGEIYGAPGGEGWVRLFDDCAGRQVFDISFDVADPTVFYAACSGKNHDRRVYRFTRKSGAPADVTVQNITSDLPRTAQVQVVEADRLRPLTVYAGTNEGVYRGTSLDNGISWAWQAFNNGLPSAVQITELDANPVSGLLRAWTFGRGAYAVATAIPIRLRVDLSVLPPGDPGRFNLQIDGITRRANAESGDFAVSSTLTPGNHVVGQSGSTGTSLSDYAVQIGGACAPNGLVALADGDDVTCSITNMANSGTAACLANCETERDTCLADGILLPQQCIQQFVQCQRECDPRLEVRLVVVPPTDPGRFDLLIDSVTHLAAAGNGATTGAVVVDAGAHVVSQTAATGTNPANYSTAISGACAASGTVAVGVGGLETCTITNIGPRLTVRLQVEPAGDPGRFHLKVDGTVRRAAAQDGDSTGTLTVSAGTHAVETAAAPGTDLSDYTTAFGGACGPNGSVVLNAGEEKTCIVRQKAKSDRPACLAACEEDRDSCLADGILLPSQCIQMFKKCVAACPPK